MSRRKAVGGDGREGGHAAGGARTAAAPPRHDGGGGLAEAASAGQSRDPRPRGPPLSPLPRPSLLRLGKRSDCYCLEAAPSLRFCRINAVRI